MLAMCRSMIWCGTMRERSAISSTRSYLLIVWTSAAVEKRPTNSNSGIRFPASHKRRAPRSAGLSRGAAVFTAVRAEDFVIITGVRDDLLVIELVMAGSAGMDVATSVWLVRSKTNNAPSTSTRATAMPAIQTRKFHSSYISSFLYVPPNTNVPRYRVSENLKGPLTGL